MWLADEIIYSADEIICSADEIIYSADEPLGLADGALTPSVEIWKTKTPQETNILQRSPRTFKEHPRKNLYVCYVNIDAYRGLCVISRSGHDFLTPKTLGLDACRPAPNVFDRPVCGHSERMNIV